MTVLPQLRAQLVSAMAAPASARRRPGLRALALAVAAVAAVVLAAAHHETHSRTAGGSPPSPVPAVQCGEGFTLRRGDVRSGWQKRAIRVGPVRFIELQGAASEPAWQFAPARALAPHLRGRYVELRGELLANGRDRYAATTTKMLVDPGRAVTITIPPGARANASMVSFVRQFGGYLPADGVHSLTISSCPPVDAIAREVRDGGALAYKLGFIVAGARCVPLEVRSAGQVYRRTISFGAGRC